MGDVFGPEFLIKRPLLQALDASRKQRAAVLLIDELDRADAEFEAYLLELLSDYQITIPEIGTLRAAAAAHRGPDLQPHARHPRRATPPLPLLLDRISLAGEGICHCARTRVPEAPDRLARQVVAFVQSLRGEELLRRPGVAETLDWLAALVTLGQTELTEDMRARLARRAAQVSGRHRRR